jgi:hypothetical protein
MSGSSDPKQFLHWYPQEDDLGWRIVDEHHAVVCSGLCDKDDAEEIARAHNVRDPIKTREDWLHAKSA